MIPESKRPFGIGTVLAATLVHRKSSGLRRLEEAYAQAGGCAAAVVLPSARAGICWALRAALDQPTVVIGPTFTCAVVHEAMVRSGSKVRLLDAGNDDFLMAAPALSASQTGPHAVVLSEVYGHAYDLAQLARNAASPSAVRIVDMAMSVPHPVLLQRLQPHDFAVVSFGKGKSMYAGWGAMGFAGDAALADEVRRIRDLVLAPAGPGLWLRRGAVIFLRTAAQHPALYLLAWNAWHKGLPALARLQAAWLRSASETASTPAPPGFPAAWLDERSRSPEWSLPSTHVDRALALWNLERAAAFYEERLALARRYHQNLDGAKGIIRPAVSPYALSHYTVRVHPDIRNGVKARLLQAGIRTISLWTFPSHLTQATFPNAFRRSGEVINLPLTPGMSPYQVDRLCDLLIHYVEVCVGGLSEKRAASAS